MQRLSNDVIQELLDEMDNIVSSYHKQVRRTARTIAELIPGTAFFPGGTGLWRGDTCFRPVPEYFPDSPVMVVAHNFDSIDAHDEYKRKGGEVLSFFWSRLKDYLEQARISPDDCFFTNALMGLKPGSAVGDMPTVPGYENECREFLVRQIEIVSPRAIITLGAKAADRVKSISSNLPWARVLHPSARELKPSATRAAFIAQQGTKIRDLLAH
jgi:hypothetical protein